MKIRYKCHCGDETEIDVTDRVKGSAISEYMKLVGHSVSYHHRASNPHCLATKMEYVKLPMDNPDGICIPKTVN